MRQYASDMSVPTEDTHQQGSGAGGSGRQALLCRLRSPGRTAHLARWHSQVQTHQLDAAKHDGERPPHVEAAAQLVGNLLHGVRPRDAAAGWARGSTLGSRRAGGQAA